MLRKLTILFAFAFFVLVIGWTVQPVHAHGDEVTCLEFHKRVSHPHCQAGDGNGNGSNQKTLVCHSDCFRWLGFYMEVKNSVDSHLKHGDHLIDCTVVAGCHQIWNEDYCCDETGWAYEWGCCSKDVGVVNSKSSSDCTDADGIILSE